MEIMDDRDLVEVHRQDRIKEVCAEWREHQQELEGFSISECESCKL